MDRWEQINAVQNMQNSALQMRFVFSSIIHFIAKQKIFWYY
jgi:hypothetical protein